MPFFDCRVRSSSTCCCPRIHLMRRTPCWRCGRWLCCWVLIADDALIEWAYMTDQGPPGRETHHAGGAVRLLLPLVHGRHGHGMAWTWHGMTWHGWAGVVCMVGHGMAPTRLAPDGAPVLSSHGRNVRLYFAPCHATGAGGHRRRGGGAVGSRPHSHVPKVC